MNQPNVGADAHLSTLQCCVHSQVDWVGCLAAVVLVNEHRVFCDVKACGIPVTNNAKTVRTEMDRSRFYRKINFDHLTYHPMMTSEAETLLWSSYMFFANSMSTATCQQRWKVYFKKREDKSTPFHEISMWTLMRKKIFNFINLIFLWKATGCRIIIQLDWYPATLQLLVNYS